MTINFEENGSLKTKSHINTDDILKCCLLVVIPHTDCVCGEGVYCFLHCLFTDMSICYVLVSVAYFVKKINQKAVITLLEVSYKLCLLTLLVLVLSGLFFGGFFVFFL